MITPQKFEIELAGRNLSFETGRLANQANASVLARYGETVVLATVCSKETSEDVSFFPLTVDYEERLYAGGRFPTSRFIKRESRPSENAILADRLIDRSIRPLFPQDRNLEVQVITTVLSVDPEDDPAVLGMLATSVVLSMSDLVWDGPLAAVRIGRKDDNFILNPTEEELSNSDLDLVVATTKEAIVMIEAGAREVKEETIQKALEFAQEQARPVLELMEEIVKEVGSSKKEISKEKVDTKLQAQIERVTSSKIKPFLESKNSEKPEMRVEQMKEEIFEEFSDKLAKPVVSQIVEKTLKEAVREKVFKDGQRPDGRSFDEIRPLSMAVAVLPRTHGSAVFQRGETQALSIVTLGSASLEQLIEGMMGEDTKRYMHHYNFPPYSMGEVRRIGPPGRREIGHGALAEKALVPVIPSEDKFPYAIRVVSEITSSNGSTSMAATCGSTLALMDAGVPISAPVAGISIGLVSSGSSYQILTDISGLEDAWGEMDFKVAGTEKGITAIQLDIKTPGVKREILIEALKKARSARLSILERMRAVLPSPRDRLSPFAPIVKILKVETSKIGEVIGSGGRTIKSIQEQTETTIDIKQDGTVTISGKDEESCQRAYDWVESLTKEAKPGEVYEGEVKRILPFGAMVEIFPGREGLVHKFELGPDQVNRVEDIVTVGQKVKVRVAEIDDQGRVNLSMRFGTDQRPRNRPQAGPEGRFQKRFPDRRPFGRDGGRNRRRG